MKIPTITGIIERRILVNYRIEPEVAAACLPAPFRPKIINGYGMAGICLIRLNKVRPKGLPEIVGIKSENGAHRIAVEWIENGQCREGVYITRRDTSSKLNALAGGRVFPGVHHLSHFKVEETEGHYKVAFRSKDGKGLSIQAEVTDQWNPESIFENVESASRFFENGSVGYSPDKKSTGFDGLELKTYHWEVTPLKVLQVRSDFFEDKSIFPEGSVVFDNALLMENITHEWNSLQKLC